MDIARAPTLRGPASHVYVALRVYELDFEGTLTAEFVHHVDPRKMVYGEDTIWHGMDSSCSTHGR